MKKPPDPCLLPPPSLLCLNQPSPSPLHPLVRLTSCPPITQLRFHHYSATCILLFSPEMDWDPNQSCPINLFKISPFIEDLLRSIWCLRIITILTLPEENGKLSLEGVVESICLLLPTAQPPATSTIYFNSWIIMVIRCPSLIRDQLQGGYPLTVPTEDFRCFFVNGDHICSIVISGVFFPLYLIFMTYLVWSEGSDCWISLCLCVFAARTYSLLNASGSCSLSTTLSFCLAFFIPL